MAEINITEFKAEEAEELVEFLISAPWPFHSSLIQKPEKIWESIKNGFYLSSEVKSFWINNENKKVGFLRLYDLEDETPMFDIRLKTEIRGKGIGEKALNWLNNYVLIEKCYRKFEGNTRVDNIAMRKLFRKCGFVKESHHRQSWPDEQGNYFDSVGYGLLREDLLENKTTPVNWDDEPKYVTGNR